MVIDLYRVSCIYNGCSYPQVYNRRQRPLEQMLPKERSRNFSRNEWYPHATDYPLMGENR